MPDLTHHCPSCGVHMQATDRETLEWGIRSHACGAAAPFAGIIRGEGRDPIECDLVCWLLGAYGRPFVWFRAGGVPLMVT